MKFSAQEEYGLRCLVAVATAGHEASLTIPEISKLEGLTPSHVAKLMSVLRKAGFVKSTRGQSGGYCLNIVPDAILIVNVLESLGGRLYGTGFCERHSGIHPECVHEGDCIVLPLWIRVQTAVDNSLQGLTLGDLLEGRLDAPPVVFYDKPERHTAVSHR